MEYPLIISAMETPDEPVEVVERKGLGHPDTICDAIAEEFSRSLSREYRRRFGHVLHHNVDKALLWGGRAAPAFGGGEVIAPINIYLAGRATSEFGAERIPIADIAVESSRGWLRANIHALDAERHVRINVLTQPVSQDLQMLFSRRQLSGVPLCNDTSVGVGHAPPSPVEQLVLALEKRVNGRDRRHERPAWGEDIKVMAIRGGGKLRLTIACAMIGRHLANIDDYLGEKAALQDLVRKLAAEHGFPVCDIDINNADEPAFGSIYLTVTGTSAEAGDDGQVGRGNRGNGLITPYQPMSIEAAAGKNPVTHVGKIYNVVARQIAAALVAELSEVIHARCLMASLIGAPVTIPSIVAVKLATRDGHPVSQLRERVEQITAERIARIPALVDDFVAGKIDLF
jgi:S-adenosylmethionine synthetase